MTSPNNGCEGDYAVFDSIRKLRHEIMIFHFGTNGALWHRRKAQYDIRTFNHFIVSVKFKPNRSQNSRDASVLKEVGRAKFCLTNLFIGFPPQQMRARAVFGQ